MKHRYLLLLEVDPDVDEDEPVPTAETMKRSTEIRRTIRELKADMKARGIKVMSFMCRHPSMESALANEQLFALKMELQHALKQEQESPCKPR